MSLATLMDTMFSAPIAHRDAVRYVATALDDFAITPELGSVWHLRYLFDDRIERCRESSKRPPAAFPFRVPQSAVGGTL